MLAALLCALMSAQDPGATAPRDLPALLATADTAAIRTVLADAPGHRLQILLAEPVTDSNGRTTLRRSRLGDPRQYFYPASAIKLCGAVAALLELNRINGELGTAFGLDSELRIEPRFAGDSAIESDPSNVDGGRLTVRHALRKLFLVSDNAAYNHCYELLGQRRLNEAMWEAGFPSCRLWHRLSEFRGAQEQAQTRGVRLRQDGVEHAIAPRDSDLALDNGMFRELTVGSGHLAGGRLVEAPLSFAAKNAILLEELQDVLVAVLRPDIQTGRRGFPGLSTGQRAFLIEALGEHPRESRNPHYDAKDHPDAAYRFLLPGAARIVPQQHLRVFDKIGRAYGFSISNCYIEDRRTGQGFFVAVVLYTNPDGVLNDDRYAYAELADPFLADVGEVLTRAVWGSGPR